MNIRHIFMTIAAVLLTSAVFADSSSVTSKKYVDDFMAGYQNKIPGSGADKLMIYDDTDGIGAKQIVSSLGSDTSATNIPDVGAVKGGLDGKQDTINGTAGYVMTGTGTAGDVGERAIYDTNTNNMDALVTAGTVNTAVTNAVNGSLIRVDENGAQNPNGTLWQIADDLTALSVCSNYNTATGTGVQDGTPTPTNPIMPTFYHQGGMILRAVGTYADSYDVNTNKITRRVGVKVLDGTENWRVHSSIPSWFQYLSSIFPDNPSAPVLSAYYLQKGNELSQLKSPEIAVGSPNATQHRIVISDARFTTADELKAWLASQYAAGTPVVVYYPLATPVTEDMPPRCQ